MATAVMAMALSTTVVALQCGFNHLDTARTSTAASQMIQSEMERLRLMNWAGITALPAQEEVNVTSVHSSASIAGGRLTIYRNVSDAAGRGSNMKEISLTAQWTSIDGQVHSRIFHMRYARNGLFDYYYNHAQS